MQLKFKVVDISRGGRVVNAHINLEQEKGCVYTVKDDGYKNTDFNGYRCKKGIWWPVQFNLSVFTGLTDCNGTEIYEGDVLRLTEISGKQTLYVVISASGCFWLTQQGCTSKQLLFYLVGKPAQTNDGKGNIKKAIWEVVGNRWQPEFKGVFGDD